MADLVFDAPLPVRPLGEMPDGHVKLHQDAHDVLAELQNKLRPLGSTAVGRAVLAAADAAAARTATDSAASVHTHTAAQVTDLVEFVQDTVAAMLVAGANVTASYDDAAGKFTIASTASGTGGSTDPEVVRDTIAAAIVAGTGIQVLVDDAADTLTISVAGVPISAVSGLQAALDAKASAVTTINYFTANYTLEAQSAGRQVTFDGTTAQVLTIPPNSAVAFPIGTTIDIAQSGTGQVSVAGGTGVAVRSRGDAFKLAGRYSVASARKMDTDVWYLFGDISA